MKLKVAIVGCGRMGVATTERTRALLPARWFPLSHADAIIAHPNLEIVAVCDISKEKAKEAASSLGLPVDAGFDDLGRMLEMHKPDVLSVATRTPGRLDILRSAIRSGVKAIHSEKPLSQELPEGEALMEEISRAGIFFTYGTLRRFMRPYRLAKRLIDEGAIGKVQEIALDHGQREQLMWTHPHSADLLLFFGGSDIVSVNAICDFDDTQPNGKLVDCDPRVEFARVVFRSGAQGLITGAGGMTARITGTDGTVAVVGNGDRVELHRKDGGQFFTCREEIDVPPAPSGTAQAFIELGDALMGKARATSISPHEVAANQRMLWAMVTSSLRNGQTVGWDEVDSDLIITGRFGELTA